MGLAENERGEGGRTSERTEQSKIRSRGERRKARGFNRFRRFAPRTSSEVPNILWSMMGKGMREETARKRIRKREGEDLFFRTSFCSDLSYHIARFVGLIKSGRISYRDNQWFAKLYDAMERF